MLFVRTLIFFLKAVGNLHSQYPGIFGEILEEDSQEGEESNSKETDDQADNQTKNAFQWLEWIDAVSERQRISWPEVYNLTIVEFLNTISYIIYKNNKEKEQIKQFQKSH